MTLSFKITGVRRLAIRLWAAGRLCRLVALVVGSKADIVIQFDGP